MSHVALDSVLWLEDIGARLPERLARLQRKTLQQRFADRVRTSEQMAPQWREGFAALCETDPPPASIPEAVRVLEDSQRAASRTLHEAFELPSGHSLDYLLQWLRLVCIRDPMYRNRKQLVMAMHVGRTHRAVQNLARRLMGRTREACREDPEYVLRQAISAFGLGR